MKKQYNIKVYDQDGSTILTTLSPKILKNEPSFTTRMNGIAGALKLDFNLPFDDFGEGTTIKAMNIIEVYAVTSSPESQKDTLIYKGYIESYQPYIKLDGSEGVIMSLQHVGALLARSYYMSGASTTVTHTAQDPESIFRSVIDHFNTIYGGNIITYNDDSTDTVGQLVNLDITDLKWNKALEKAHELTPEGWYWYIAPNGVAHLKNKALVSQHTFAIGRDVKEISSNRTVKDSLNHVILRHKIGTANKTTVYENSTAQETYGTGSPAKGRMSKIFNETYITDQNAADQFGNKKVNEQNGATIQAKAIISTPYDIESIEVGQTCRIVNFKGSGDFLDDNMQIVSINYSPDQIRIEIGDYQNDLAVAIDRVVNT